MKYVVIISESKKIKIRREQVEPLVKYLTKIIGMKCSLFKVVGSYRREKPMIGDLELLVSGITTDDVLKTLTRSKNIDILEKLWKGSKKMALIISSKKFNIKKLQLEVYVAKPYDWGAALLTRTGPKELNIMMRTKAASKKLKLNEYGLFNKQNKKVAGRTEKSIFDYLGIDYLEPNERNI